MATPNANIARHLAAMAASRGDAPALKVPRGRRRDGQIDYLTLSFAQLDAEASGWQRRFTAAGLRRGDRTLVMVRPGLPLIASVFALFRLGAVPVIIDPGMGLRSFLQCVLRTRPRALVGIPLAQIISRLFPSTFSSVNVRLAVSSSLVARVEAAPSPLLSAVEATSPSLPRDLAAILFTSGSTGAPKGVRYEHGMFEAQVRMIQSAYAIAPGEIDLPLLPIFALFNPALGMATIVPEIDPRRPATLDPAKIVQAIRQEGVTNSFGSPTLWRIIGDHCLKQKITLPTLRRVLCAGAPVPAALWTAAPRFLTAGKLHSPYGATEALPIASVSSDEWKPGTSGSPIGRPFADAQVRIVALSDAPIASIAETRELPSGEIGEIIVQGPMVTRAYDHLPEATAAAKIPDPGTGTFWHRMGDCGWKDASGALWFCGRKVERVVTATGTLYTEPCEQIFRTHPRAARCALIGLGESGTQIPALVVETRAKSLTDARALASELRALGRTHPSSDAVRNFFFRSAFPVDVRHNAKIHRLTLRSWAARNRPVIAPD